MKPIRHLLLFLLLAGSRVLAAPIVSVQSGNWNDPATWSGSALPAAGDNVTIANGHTVTVTANATCATVTIGNNTLNQNTLLIVNAGSTLAVNGVISITPPLAPGIDNTLDVADGTVNCTSVKTNNSADDASRCLVKINSGTLRCTAAFLMAANTVRNKLVFSGAGLLQLAANGNNIADAQFTAASGKVDYASPAGQMVLALNYHSLKCSNAGSKTLAGNIRLNGDLEISGTAQLDASNLGNYNINIAGNWTVTSTNTNPFYERKGTVTLDGTSGIQVFNTLLAAETFYNLTINNTAGNSGTDVQFNKNCAVSQMYTHTSGKIDLKGKKLLVASANYTGGFVTCALSGGSIKSSVAGASVSFTDAKDSTFVNFSGTSVGDAAFPVNLNVNTGRINIENLSLYGTGAFIKTHADDDIVSTGGNKFYKAVTFTLNAGAGNWWTGMGSNAVADSFFAKSTFTTYATSPNITFIVGANSTGNYYGDTLYAYARSASHLWFGSNNPALNGGQSSHYFNKLANALLYGSGTIVMGQAQNQHPCSMVFNGMLKLTTVAASSGNIYVGTNDGGSTVTLTANAQLTSGLAGANTVYLYNITQLGTLLQKLTNTATNNSTIIAGDNNAGNSWHGAVNFAASNLDIAFNTFSGASNTFTVNNTAVDRQCRGGNTFDAGTLNYFHLYSPVNWFLATEAADHFYGDVTYRNYSTGIIHPAYNSNCNYSGKISIQGTSGSVLFADAANGRVTFDGSTISTISNSNPSPLSIRRFTLDKGAAGYVTLAANLQVPAGGDVSLVSGRLITKASMLLILMDPACTITQATSASTSFIDGPLQINVASTASNTLHFPIGKRPECRPLDLTVQHTSTTSYSYTAELTLGNANTFGWADDSGINNVSTRRWWDIKRTLTSNGTNAPSTDLAVSPLPVVSFYYGVNDKANTPAYLTICKNSVSDAAKWFDIGATGAIDGAGKVTSTSSPSLFNSFSRFSLGYYGSAAPTANDNSRCGPGAVTISATPQYGEEIDWYAVATGGTPLLTNSTSFTTPVLVATKAYYAEARNSSGYTSARTVVRAHIYDQATISSFTPASGEPGTAITINGTNFASVTSVTFGGLPAASFTVNSGTKITAIVGTGSQGFIEVINACGTTTKAGFTYLPSTVWTGDSSDSWTDPDNWTGGVPTGVSTARIPAVSRLPLISANQTVKLLKVEAGATVDIAVGNHLDVYDSLINAGTITGGGQIVLSGSGIQHLSGNGNYNNLALNNPDGAIISPGANMVYLSGTYTPISGILTTNDNLTLKSTASSTGIIAQGKEDGGYLSGNITLERFIPARRAWRMLSIPLQTNDAPQINSSFQEGAGGNALLNPNPGYGTHITGGTALEGFDQTTNNSASMKEWKNSSWQPIASTNESFSSIFPYFVFIRGSRTNDLNQGSASLADNTTLRITGSIKQGTQQVAITDTGWRLAGNPFPSVINLDMMAAANNSIVSRNFTFWDPKLSGSGNVGGYVTASYNGIDYDYSPTPGSDLSEFAQPFTGFYVYAVAPGTLSITEAVKSNSGNGNVFRPAAPIVKPSKLYVNLCSINNDGTSAVVDGTLTAYSDAYSNELDNFDPAKIANNLTENLSLARANKKLSIERRQSITGTDTIYLDIANMKMKKYRIQISAQNFDQLANSAVIEDRYTGKRKSISLTDSSILDFAVNSNPASSMGIRFKIILQRGMKPIRSGIAKTIAGKAIHDQAAGIKLVQNPVINNTLLLNLSKQQEGSYTVNLVNTAGKQITQSRFYHDGINGIKNIRLQGSLLKGTYIATITGPENDTVSFSILVQ